MNNYNTNKNDIISAIFKLFELLDAQDKKKIFYYFSNSSMCFNNGNPYGVYSNEICSNIK